MLMHDKIISDRYYCIKSAETKEMMVHYILQPRHIFIRVKAFDFMLIPGELHFPLGFQHFPLDLANVNE